METDGYTEQYVSNALDLWLSTVLSLPRLAAGTISFGAMVWKGGVTDDLDLLTAELFDDIPRSQLAYELGTR